MPQVPEALPPVRVGTSRFVLASAADVALVPPLARGNVPDTCVVRLTPLSAPPKVKFPEVVTVPDREIPLTVPVPPTLVTVPVLDVLLLNVFQSVLVRYPLTDVVAAAMLITGVVPPEETTGAVPVTEETLVFAAAVTKAVVANWVVLVPGEAVGATGTPVKVGELNGAAFEVIVLAPSVIERPVTTLAPSQTM
jgi:hypothetical protein